MKLLFTSLLLIFTCFNLVYSQGNSNEAFDDQIKKAEKALQDKDLTKAKSILSSQPLKSKQNNPKVKELTLKVTVYETIINGNNNLAASKWDDAIIEADKGLAFLNSNPSIFKGNEKSELDQIKTDAQNGKTGNNSSNSSSTSGQQNAATINDLGDPIDYKTGRDQMIKTYENDKKEPFETFERNKDTMKMENKNREDKIKESIVQNEKRIDTVLNQISTVREKNIQEIDKNSKDYQKERDKVIEARNNQVQENANYIKETAKETEKEVTLMNEANNNRNKEIIQNIDSTQKINSKTVDKIEENNKNRVEIISSESKKSDSLSRVVNESIRSKTEENAKYVAENTKKMEEYRQMEPIETRGSGKLNSKGIPYQVGVTQGVFSKGEKGKTYVLITRRVKVDKNNNVDIYLRYETPNSVTTYTKNGETITEYTWNVESGNVVYFE